MKNIFSAILLVLGFTSVSQAGFLVEPGVGYNSGTSTISISGVEGKLSDTAIAAGLRLGYRTGSFWAGVDGDFAFSGKSKPDSGTTSDYSSTTGYLAFGYDFPNRFRAWAGVGLMDSLLIKGDTSSSDVTYSGGLPFKIGVGYVVANHVSLNVSFSKHDYKKFKTDLVSGDLSDLDTTVSSQEAVLSVSFPFAM